MSNLRFLLVAIALLGPPLVATSARAGAPETVPELWLEASDDFEGSISPLWSVDGTPQHVPGMGVSSSDAMRVTTGQSDCQIKRSDLPESAEGYLSFHFNPASISIPYTGGGGWLPGESIRIAHLRGKTAGPSPQWLTMASLYVYQPDATPGADYKAYLHWHNAEGGSVYDYTGEFSLPDAWTRVTLGFKAHEWIAVWLDGVKTREVLSPSQALDTAYIVQVGKNNSNTPPGFIYYDNVEYGSPRLYDLYVDAETGDDSNEGGTSDPLRTIQRAATLAQAGCTVHVRPGIYRESARPARSGTVGSPIVYQAESGPGTVEIRGSEQFAPAAWRRATSGELVLPSSVDYRDVYVLELPDWTYTRWSGDSEHDYSTDIVCRAQGGSFERLRRAREPDWEVTTWWKVHENWWRADDDSFDSYDELKDTADDAGLEPGHLAAFTDLTGATIRAMDTYQGHYQFRRTIEEHTSGTITVSETVDHDSSPGFGRRARYYLENHSELMDRVGEWIKTGQGENQKIHLLTGDGLTSSELGELEIGKRYYGFDLAARSYVELRDLTFRFIDRDASPQIYNGDAGAIVALTGHLDESAGLTIAGCTIEHCVYGLWFNQDVDSGRKTLNPTVDGCTIADIDGEAMSFNSWPQDGSLSTGYADYTGIEGIVVKNCTIGRIAIYPTWDGSAGLSFSPVNKVAILNNHIFDVGHNGMQFYGPNPGHVLVQGNLIERCCLYGTDAGAIKFHGGRYAYADGQGVFTDALVMDNAIRDTRGWASAREERDIDNSYWFHASPYGQHAYGVYMDWAGGVSCYRNAILNIGMQGIGYANNHRSGSNYIYNNTIWHTMRGVLMGKHRSQSPNPPDYTDTRIVGNIFCECETGDVELENAPADSYYSPTHDLSCPGLTMDYNLHKHTASNPFPTHAYFSDSDYNPSVLEYVTADNHLAEYDDFFGGSYPLRSLTPFEEHGHAQQPGETLFVQEGGTDPERYRLRADSPAVDASTSPDPILAMIDRLETALGLSIDPLEPPDGLWDMGAYEYTPPPTRADDVWQLY
ncbi:right-handed parallel beta-helix repeat-containing protein [Candidatus Sumerlaeota bacterium]|nr:right-handed parallel beta-helix repeat-containing protein [Candidatus Sumerlaeota bacterium]